MSAIRSLVGEIVNESRKVAALNAVCGSRLGLLYFEPLLPRLRQERHLDRSATERLAGARAIVSLSKLRLWLKELAKSVVAWVLASLGARMSARSIYHLNTAISHLETARWLSAKGLKPTHRVTDQTALFDLILARVATKEVLYLEFGVYQGKSMRYWSAHLKHSKAMLHGFDSFEGLPEAWDIDSPKGHFSTGGSILEIDDARVKFYKGWFDQTLPTYAFPNFERLVVNMDADLYSSTKCVLSLLRPHLVIGSYLYFDEFADQFNELKAFAEFVESTGWRFELLAVNKTLSRVVFRRLE